MRTAPALGLTRVNQSRGVKQLVIELREGATRMAGKLKSAPQRVDSRSQEDASTAE